MLRRDKNMKCVDCKKFLGKWSDSNKSKRCNSCENKRRHKLGILGKGNFKHGKYQNNKKCKDCGQPITVAAIRCGSCACKEKLKNPEKHPMYIDNRTNKWKIVRKQCFERDNYTCILCRRRGNIYLNAHHIINRHICKDKFDINNLVTLCTYCHNHITSIEDTEGYNVYKDFFQFYTKKIKL
jgi:hypothetical protein